MDNFFANLASITKRQATTPQDFTVIALGGSVVVSNNIQKDFLKKFKRFLEEYLKQGRKFILVIGGGQVARDYQNAASHIAKINNEDKDWLGVHSTRLNAHLLRTIFQKYAYPVVLDNPEKQIKKRDLHKYALFVASGSKPGWSTDYIAFRMAERFAAPEVLIATKIPYIYEKDIHKYKDAKPIEQLSWKRYTTKILPNKVWQPGMKAPIDPIAAKFAMQNNINCVLLRANNLSNLRNYLNSQDFKGTIIKA